MLPLIQEQAILDTVKILVEIGQIDPMIRVERQGQPEQSVLHLWRGPSNVFLWLLRQDEFEVDVTSPFCSIDSTNQKNGWTIYHRLAWGMSATGSLVLLDTFWRDEYRHLHHTIATAIDAFGWTVLHVASAWLRSKEARASRDPYYASISEYKEDMSYRWNLVRALLTAGADVHARDGKGRTPLYRFSKHRCLPDNYFLNPGEELTGQVEPHFLPPPSYPRSHLECESELEIASAEQQQQQQSENRQSPVLPLVRKWLAILAETGHDVRAYAEEERLNNIPFLSTSPFPFPSSSTPFDPTSAHGTATIRAAENIGEE